MAENVNNSGLPLYHLDRIGPAATMPAVPDVMDLSRVTTVIGRNPRQADYVLDSSDKMRSTYISRLHARIIREGENHKLRDDSLNGIFVNHVKIAGSVILQEGDLVTFGHPNGSNIPAGSLKRQSDSEYQFLFGRCDCPENTKIPSVSTAQNKTEPLQAFNTAANACQTRNEKRAVFTGLCQNKNHAHVVHPGKTEPILQASFHSEPEVDFETVVAQPITENLQRNKIQHRTSLKSNSSARCFKSCPYEHPELKRARRCDSIEVFDEQYGDRTKAAQGRSDLLSLHDIRIKSEPATTKTSSDVHPDDRCRSADLDYREVPNNREGLFSTRHISNEDETDMKEGCVITSAGQSEVTLLDCPEVILISSESESEENNLESSTLKTKRKLQHVKASSQNGKKTSPIFKKPRIESLSEPKKCGSDRSLTCDTFHRKSLKVESEKETDRSFISSPVFRKSFAENLLHPHSKTHATIKATGSTTRAKLFAKKKSVPEWKFSVPIEVASPTFLLSDSSQESGEEENIAASSQTAPLTDDGKHISSQTIDGLFEVENVAQREAVCSYLLNENSSEKQVLGTVLHDDKLLETGKMDENIPLNYANEKKVLQYDRIDEQMNETDVIDENIPEMAVLDENVDETSMSHEEIQKIDVMNGRIAETDVIDQRIPKIEESVNELLEERFKETEVLKETNPERSLMDGNTHNSDMINDETGDTSVLDDKVPETDVMHETNSETGAVEEEITKTDVVDGELPEGYQMDEKIIISAKMPTIDAVEIAVEDEKIPELDVTDQTIPQTSALVEISETDRLNEKIPEAVTMKKKIHEAKVILEKIQETDIMNEKIPHSDVVTERVPEAMIKKIPKLDELENSIPETSVPESHVMNEVVSEVAEMDKKVSETDVLNKLIQEIDVMDKAMSEVDEQEEQMNSKIQDTGVVEEKNLELYMEYEEIPGRDVRIFEIDTMASKVPRTYNVNEAVPERDVIDETIPETDVLLGNVPKTDVREEKIPKTDVVGEKTPYTEKGEEEICETNVMEEKYPESDVMDEEIPETNVVEEKTTETDMVEEKTLETDMVEEKTRQMYSIEKKCSETDIKEEKTPEHVMEDKTSEIDMMEEKPPETDVEEEKTPETDVMEEKPPETDVEEEKPPETDVEDKKTPETDVWEEKTPETDVIEDKTPETDVEEEKTPETDLMEERTPETYVEKEKTPETCFEEENTPETYVEEEKTPETDLMEERTPETYVEKERTPETDVMEEKTPETDVDDEKTPETHVWEERTPETDVEKEKTPETDVMEEMTPETDVEEEKTLETDVEEKHPETDLWKEKTPENVMEEKTPETDVEKEKTPETDVMEEKTCKLDVMEEKTPETDVVEKETPENVVEEMTCKSHVMEKNSPETDAMKEKAPETELIGEKTYNNEVVKEKFSETDAMEEETCEIDVVEEKNQETEMVKKDSPDTVVVEEKTCKTDVMEKYPEIDMMEEETSEMMEEKTPETDVMEGTTCEINVMDEKFQETDVIEEKTPETHVMEKKTCENDVIEEKTCENDVMDEKTSETDGTEEKIQETDDVHEKALETDLLDKKFQETDVMEGKIKSMDVIEENSPEDNVVVISTHEFHVIHKKTLVADVLMKNKFARNVLETSVMHEETEETDEFHHKAPEIDMEVEEIAGTDLMEKISETWVIEGKASATDMMMKELAKTNVTHEKVLETDILHQPIPETEMVKVEMAETKMTQTPDTSMRREKIPETVIEEDIAETDFMNKIPKSGIMLEEIHDTSVGENTSKTDELEEEMPEIGAAEKTIHETDGLLEKRQDTDVMEDVITETDFTNKIQETEVLDEKIQMVENFSETGVMNEMTSDIVKKGDVTDTVVIHEKMLETEVMIRKNPETEMVVEKTSDTDVVEERIPESEVSKDISLEMYVMENETSETDVKEKKTPEMDVKEKKTPEMDVKEKKTPEMDVMEKEMPEMDVMEKEMPEMDVMEEKISETDLMKGKTPEIKLAEEKNPEMDLMELDTLENGVIEGKLQGTVMSQIEIRDHDYLMCHKLGKHYLDERVHKDCALDKNFSQGDPLNVHVAKDDETVLGQITSVDNTAVNNVTCQIEEDETTDYTECGDDSRKVETQCQFENDDVGDQRFDQLTEEHQDKVVKQQTESNTGSMTSCDGLVELNTSGVVTDSTSVAESTTIHAIHENVPNNVEDETEEIHQTTSSFPVKVYNKLVTDHLLHTDVVKDKSKFENLQDKLKNDSEDKLEQSSEEAHVLTNENEPKTGFDEKTETLSSQRDLTQELFPGSNLPDDLSVNKKLDDIDPKTQSSCTLGAELSPEISENITSVAVVENEDFKISTATVQRSESQKHSLHEEADDLTGLSETACSQDFHLYLSQANTCASESLEQQLDIDSEDPSGTGEQLQASCSSEDPGLSETKMDEVFLTDSQKTETENISEDTKLKKSTFCLDRTEEMIDPSDGVREVIGTLDEDKSVYNSLTGTRPQGEFLASTPQKNVEHTSFPSAYFGVEGETELKCTSKEQAAIEKEFRSMDSTVEVSSLSQSETCSPSIRDRATLRQQVVLKEQEVGLGILQERADERDPDVSPLHSQDLHSQSNETGVPNLKLPQRTLTETVPSEDDFRLELSTDESYVEGSVLESFEDFLAVSPVIKFCDENVNVKQPSNCMNPLSGLGKCRTSSVSSEQDTTSSQVNLLQVSVNAGEMDNYGKISDDCDLSSEVSSESELDISGVAPLEESVDDGEEINEKCDATTVDTHKRTESCGFSPNINESQWVFDTDEPAACVQNEENESCGFVPCLTKEHHILTSDFSSQTSTLFSQDSVDSVKQSQDENCSCKSKCNESNSDQTVQPLNEGKHEKVFNTPEFIGETFDDCVRRNPTSVPSCVTSQTLSNSAEASSSRTHVPITMVPSQFIKQKLKALLTSAMRHSESSSNTTTELASEKGEIPSTNTEKDLMSSNQNDDIPDVDESLITINLGEPQVKIESLVDESIGRYAIRQNDKSVKHHCDEDMEKSGSLECPVKTEGFVDESPETFPNIQHDGCRVHDFGENAKGSGRVAVRVKLERLAEEATCCDLSDSTVEKINIKIEPGEPGCIEQLGKKRKSSEDYGSEAKRACLRDLPADVKCFDVHGTVKTGFKDVNDDREQVLQRFSSDAGTTVKHCTRGAKEDKNGAVAESEDDSGVHSPDDKAQNKYEAFECNRNCNIRDDLETEYSHSLLVNTCNRQSDEISASRPKHFLQSQGDGSNDPTLRSDHESSPIERVGQSSALSVKNESKNFCGPSINAFQDRAVVNHSDKRNVECDGDMEMDTSDSDASSDSELHLDLTEVSSEDYEVYTDNDTPECLGHGGDNTVSAYLSETEEGSTVQGSSTSRESSVISCFSLDTDCDSDICISEGPGSVKSKVSHESGDNN